ncbi:MAG: 2,4'-dihydroxyacetophenone dioxygenase family protein [Acidimicrobiales bacterium]
MTLQEAEASYLDVETKVDRMRDKYAMQEGYIGADEAVSPWVPFVENVWIRHLTFDVRSSSASNVLWVGAGGLLGRHRHRGPVSGYTLEGTWRYLEYDWTAGPGDFVRESPGRTHTLYSEKGMKTFFWLNGPLEFLDDENRVTEVVDVFWFINHYETYCEEKGLPINKLLYL